MPKQIPAPPSPNVTVKAVARHAGVSMMTVSRALRTPELVTAKTLAIVRDSIQKTGYVPNKLAGSLASGRSGQVAMLIPSIANRFFADLIDGASLGLEAQGLQIIISQFHYSEQRCQEQILALMSWAPDALIIVGPVPQSSRNFLTQRGIPVLETLELLEKPLDINVGLSHTQGGAAAGEYLLSCGYRRLTCICSSPTRDRRAYHRVQGVQEVWREQGLPEPELVISDNPSPLAGGHECMSRILHTTPLPDAVFCTNDELAFSALMVTRAAGLRVPEDIGFMGFNGLEISRQSIPSITTVQVDSRAIGQQCAELLLARLAATQGNTIVKNAPIQVDVGFTLIEGQSTCRT